MKLRLAAVALWLWLALAAPAVAADCTVGDAQCPDLQAALDRAAEAQDADVVRLPAGAVPARAGGFAYAGGGPLQVLGAGVDATTVPGPLRLDAPEVAVRALSLGLPPDPDRAALEAAGGIATGLRVVGEASASGQAAIRALPGAPFALEDAEVTATGLDAALDAGCGAELRARHVTLAGTAPAGARADCATATLTLRSSVVAEGYPAALAGAGASAAHSNLAGTTTDGAQQSEPVPGDPGFRSPTDLRPAPGSPLIDRGDPAALAIDSDGDAIDASEPQEDLTGEVRVADGDGDGATRRDVGAHELTGPALFVPSGNVLANPDAEAAAPGPPPGWVLTGGFTTVDFGTLPFPTLKAGAALGGGARFFAGGTGGDASATQVVDLSGAANQIDSGGGRATFSGLLGGFRADGDEPRAQATFRGPSGVALASLELAPVDAAARGNATHLLARIASGAVPPLTRSVEVVLRAGKAPGGSYTDAYFDNLGLTLALPAGPGGGPGGGPGDGPGGGGGGGGGGGIVRPELRAFSGIGVLSGSVTLSRTTGRAKLLVGCASATVARCTGALDLTATLVRRRPRAAVGRVGVSLAPGAARRVSVRLSRAARNYLRRHTRLRVRVQSTAVDGQGVRRTRVVPIVVRRR